MSTYRQIFYQIVFGTKNRQPTLAKEHEEELYKYIWGIVKNKNCKLYRVMVSKIIFTSSLIFILQYV